MCGTRTCAPYSLDNEREDARAAQPIDDGWGGASQSLAALRAARPVAPFRARRQQMNFATWEIATMAETERD